MTRPGGLAGRDSTRMTQHHDDDDDSVISDVQPEPECDRQFLR